MYIKRSFNHKSLTIASDPGGDWEGLYVDGKLVDEDHSLDVRRVLEKLGYVVDTFEVDEAWLLKRGRLPNSVSQVKRARS